MLKKPSPAAHGLSFLSLTILFFLVFMVYPITFSVILSFFKWKGYSPNPFENFIGLANYRRMINARIFWQSLKNTFVFVLGSLVLQNLFGFLAAIFLFYADLRSSIVWKAILFFPCLLSAVVVGIVFRRIFLQNGLFNLMIRLFFSNYQGFSWLGNLVTPIYVVIFVSVWKWFGYNMVIYYAGLQSLDEQITESAKIDGASWLVIIIRIVIPQLYKTISMAVILNIIGGFKVFDIVYVMTGGGPTHASEVLTSYVYYHSFSLYGTNLMGYASSLAVTLTVIVLFFAVLRLWVDKKAF